MTLSIRTTRDGAAFSVSCRPGSPRTRFSGARAGSVRLDVAAPPERGKANAEVLRFLAKALGVPTSALAISAGAQGREKSIRVFGMTSAQLAERLDAAGAAKT